LGQLVESNDFEVPSGMIDDQLKSLLEEMKMRRAYGGQDPSTIQFSDAEIADLRGRALFAAKSSCILASVANKENIVVEDADIDAKIHEIASMRGQAVEAIRGYLEREQAYDVLSERIIEEKTLGWLLEHAELVDALSEGQAKPKSKRKKSAAKKKTKKSASTGGEDAAVALTKGSVGDLKSGLKSGDHDAHLGAMLAAEEAGKARKGALAAIKERMV